MEDKICGFIFFIIKGNIDLLVCYMEYFDEVVFFWKMVENIVGYFYVEEWVYVIFNVCILGVLVFIVGKCMIENGIYCWVIVVGGDFFFYFIISGFGFFWFFSFCLCCLYDSSCDGLNLGEVCGVVLFSLEGIEEYVIFLGGVVSNDVNYIFGFFCMGDGFYFVIC